MVEINLLKHSLVPKHEILTKEEVQKLLEKYNISEGQLPLIRAKDPIIKEIDAKPDDVIKITREIKTGKDVTYRRVI